MRRRLPHAFRTIVASLAATACSSEQIGSHVFQPQDQTAKLKVINAATPAMHVVVDGVGVAGPLDFGEAPAQCLTVNSRNPKVGVRYGTVTSLYDGVFVDGEQSYVVASTYGSGAGATYNVLRVPFDTASGVQARLRLVNVSGSGPYDLHVTDPNAPLGTASSSGVATGTTAAPFYVPSGDRYVRLTQAGTQNVVLNLGARQFENQKREILIIAPPDTGSTVRAFFYSNTCT